jgi:hypothetical protein
MFGDFTLYALGDDTLNAFFTVYLPRNNDLDAIFSPRVERYEDLDATFEVMYGSESSLDSTIMIMSPSDIPATLEVRPSARMFGLFDLYEPPRIEVDLPPIKDANVRNSNEYTYVNFGTINGMEVGRGYGEDFISYVDFDLEQFEPSTVFEEAKLRLNYAGTLKDGTQIELRKVTRMWTETGITYASRPASSEVISDTFIHNKEDKYIEFDFMDYVNRIVRDEEEDFGFAIFEVGQFNKTNTFLTKENHNPSHLYLKYYDSRVQSYGDDTLDATLFAVGTGTSDLDATFEVHSTYGFDDLSATFYAHRYDTPYPTDLQAFFYVSRPDLTSIFFNYATGNSDLDGTLLTKIPRFDFLDSMLNVSKPDLESTFEVKHHENIDATLHVRALGESDLGARFLTSRPEIDSMLEVRFYKHLDGTFVVQQAETEDIDATFGVSRQEVDSILEVKSHSNIDATFIVRQRENEDLSSILVSTKPEIDATFRAMIYAEDDIESTFYVRALGKSDIGAVFLTSRPKIDAKLEVKYHDNIDATFVVRRNETDVVNAIFLTSRPEIDAFVQPRIHDDLSAMLGISRRDIDGTFAPRAIDWKDIDAIFYPRVVGVSDLNARIAVDASSTRTGYYFIM